jgi:hypothetical protein
LHGVRAAQLETAKEFFRFLDLDGNGMVLPIACRQS